jgi:hypothetical protein
MPSSVKEDANPEDGKVTRSVTSVVPVQVEGLKWYLRVIQAFLLSRQAHQQSSWLSPRHGCQSAWFARSFPTRKKTRGTHPAEIGDTCNGISNHDFQPGGRVERQAQMLTRCHSRVF